MSVRRPFLLPLAPAYEVALAIKRQLLRWGWLKRKQLENPVISIGSISAGGAGKTPMVLMLVRALRQRGYAVRILTRGYKRTSDETTRVEPFDDAALRGDEPVLLAQRSGVPVYVGSDRYQAGVMAERKEPSERRIVHLLDDGFQHRRLARDVDIVLLTQADVEDTLLPAGNLREPLATLADADIIVLREEEENHLRVIISRLTGDNKTPLIWTIRRTLSLGEGGEVALPTRPLAFCAIARPESFTTMLAAQGYEPMATVTFRDHHTYNDADMTHLVEQARLCEANGFVTTEKDAVKLTPILRDRLTSIGPIIVPRLGVELIEEQNSLSQLLSMVGRLDRRKH
jgi:tetraacyldisaccharide 4'-kinase